MMKKARKKWADALGWLGKAQDMEPLMVLGGDLDEYSSNHLLLMAYSLERSREKMEAARAKLGQGEQ